MRREPEIRRRPACLSREALREKACAEAAAKIAAAKDFAHGFTMTWMAHHCGESD